MNEKELCPNCNTELEWTRVKDAQAGDILITTEVTYCPKCNYLHSYNVKISG